MKFSSVCLGVVLGGTADAFVAVPRPSFGAQVRQRPVSSTSSRLAFYPNDDDASFAQRLKNVQMEWSKINAEGIGKFFSDELSAANQMLKEAGEADKSAKDVIEQVAEDSNNYLLKESFHSMVEGGKMIANEMREVKQEFEEIKASRIVESVAEDVISNGVTVEKELEEVVENVVSSLTEAQNTIQTAIKMVATSDSITEKVKADTVASLEVKAKNIEESIKVADTVAQTAKKIATVDEKVMAEMEQTTSRLSDAIESTELITKTMKGAEGGSTVDSVATTLDSAAKVVVEDAQSAERIADTVDAKVEIAASAVIKLGERASGLAESVRDAKTKLQSTDIDSQASLQSLKEELVKSLEDIQTKQSGAEQLASAIKSDATNDQAALGVLQNTDQAIGEMIDSVDTTVKEVDSSISKSLDEVGSVAETQALSKSTEKMCSEVEMAEGSVDDMEKATESCRTSEVEKLQEIEDKAAASKPVQSEAKAEKITEKITDSKVDAKASEQKPEAAVETKVETPKVDESKIETGQKVEEEKPKLEDKSADVETSADNTPKPDDPAIENPVKQSQVDSASEDKLSSDNNAVEKAKTSQLDSTTANEKPVNGADSKAPSAASEPNEPGEIKVSQDGAVEQPEGVLESKQSALNNNVPDVSPKAAAAVDENVKSVGVNVEVDSAKDNARGLLAEKEHVELISHDATPSDRVDSTVAASVKKEILNAADVAAHGDSAGKPAASGESLLSVGKPTGAVTKDELLEALRSTKRPGSVDPVVSPKSQTTISAIERHSSDSALESKHSALASVDSLSEVVGGNSGEIAHDKVTLPDLNLDTPEGLGDALASLATASTDATHSVHDLSNALGDASDLMASIHSLFL